jgi:hypothetical protein
MSIYSDNEIGSTSSPAKAVGFILALAGLVVILWTVAEIFQLFTHGSAFVTLNEIIPQKMILADSGKSYLLLPRELLIYGLPIWAFSVTSKIGLTLLKTGLEYIERPQKISK